MYHPAASEHIRRLPLWGIFLLTCLSPFCLARAVDTQLPAVMSSMSIVRAEEKAVSQKQDVTAQQKACIYCMPYQMQALQNVLTHYKQLAEAGGWPSWKIGKKLHEGQSDARIPTLRQILTITGDYQPAADIPVQSVQAQPAAIQPAAAQPAPAPSTEFDEALVDAVKHFQERHGLNIDGKLGKSTQAALAVPVEKRIVQIMATLARMHDFNPVPEDKFILVNLPAYTLYAVKQDTLALSMRVIVGNRKNHTPTFDNRVTDVVFNPPWSVPVRIARNELIPKLRSNPSYFIKAGFVVTQDGVPIDPMAASAEDNDISFRQQPGAGNALGKIKFNIPDKDDIYLHSTSTPRLFATEDRALSHGCVRLQKPRELAYFVMENITGWDTTKIDHAYDASKERHVPVTSIPVHLVYWTAYVDAEGHAYFYNDVYGKDNATVASAERKGTMITLASK